MKPNTYERQRIDELEYLAQEFIIGTKPMTDEQKETLANIRAMESQLQITKTKVIRIEKVIDALYRKLYWNDKK